MKETMRGKREQNPALGKKLSKKVKGAKEKERETGGKQLIPFVGDDILNGLHVSHTTG